MHVVAPHLIRNSPAEMQRLQRFADAIRNMHGAGDDVNEWYQALVQANHANHFADVDSVQHLYNIMGNHRDALGRLYIQDYIQEGFLRSLDNHHLHVALRIDTVGNILAGNFPWNH